VIELSSCLLTWIGPARVWRSTIPSEKPGSQSYGHSRSQFLAGELVKLEIAGIPLTLSMVTDMAWMIVMATICVTTFAVSSLVLRYAPWNRS
jgi:hypothetical protein